MSDNLPGYDRWKLDNPWDSGYYQEDEYDEEAEADDPANEEED